MGNCPGAYSFWFLLQSFVSRSFFFLLLRYCFLILLSSLFDDVRYQYSKVLVIFLLPKGSDAFLIWQFYSFHCFSFPTFHYRQDAFFNAKFHSSSFFPTALTNGLSLESEWQQVSSSLQDSSQYSDRSQQCCSLDNSSSDFQLFQSFSQAFGDRSKRANYNLYDRHLHLSLLSCFSGKVEVLISSFSLIFALWLAGTAISFSFFFSFF